MTAPSQRKRFKRSRCLCRKKLFSTRLQFPEVWSVILVLLCSSVLYSNTPLHAADPPPWLQEGYSALQTGRYSEAAQRFQAAAQANPQDITAAFFSGVSLNRLGQHEVALRYLERITGSTSATPNSNFPADLEFERGWALLGVKQWNEAIAALERYEKSSPGRGQTSEFLGRAYFGLAQWDKAETFLKQAVERDKRLEASATYYLAQIAAKRGESQQARALWTALMSGFPNSPLSRAARGSGLKTDGLDDITGLLSAPEASSKPYEFSVRAGGGYNSNVIALGDGIPLPVDISRRSSSLLNFGFGAAYKKVPSPGNAADKATWRLGYDFAADMYPSVQSANLQTHFLTFDYGKALKGRWSGGLRLADQFSFIGGSRFSNQVLLRPALAYRHNDRAATELAYSFANANYYFATTAVQDRDGTNHVLGLTHFWRQKLWQFNAGVFQAVNRADGADFDFDGPGVVLGASRPLGKRNMANFVFSHTRERYDNPNSVTGFTTTRRDNRSALALQLTRSLNASTSLYAQYSFNKAASNIAVFDYKQHIISGGLNYRF